MEPELHRLEKLDPDKKPVARRELPASNTRNAPHLALTAAGQLVMSDPSEEQVKLLNEKLS